MAMALVMVVMRVKMMMAVMMVMMALHVILIPAPMLWSREAPRDTRGLATDSHGPCTRPPNAPLAPRGSQSHSLEDEAFTPGAFVMIVVLVVTTVIISP